MSKWISIANDTCLQKRIIEENENYFKDEISNKYISCSILDNCIKCKSKTECISCQEGFFINNNICEKIESDKNKNLSTGAIIGIIVGCLCFLILVGVLVWYFYKLKASKNIIPQKEEITNGKNLKGQENEKENANQIEKDSIVIHNTKRIIHN